MIKGSDHILYTEMDKHQLDLDLDWSRSREGAYWKRRRQRINDKVAKDLHNIHGWHRVRHDRGDERFLGWWTVSFRV